VSERLDNLGAQWRCPGIVGHEVADRGLEDPAPPELLLAEDITNQWLVLETLTAFYAGQFQRREHKGEREHKGATISGIAFLLKMQESAHRRYLAAIRELARVRKLQAGAPALQVNTQINILGA
jgi:hypothetical protein